MLLFYYFILLAGFAQILICALALKNIDSRINSIPPSTVVQAVTRTVTSTRYLDDPTSPIAAQSTPFVHDQFGDNEHDLVSRDLAYYAKTVTTITTVCGRTRSNSSTEASFSSTQPVISTHTSITTLSRYSTPSEKVHTSLRSRTVSPAVQSFFPLCSGNKCNVSQIVSRLRPYKPSFSSRTFVPSSSSVVIRNASTFTGDGSGKCSAFVTTLPTTTFTTTLTRDTSFTIINTITKYVTMSEKFEENDTKMSTKTARSTPVDSFSTETSFRKENVSVFATVLRTITEFQTITPLELSSPFTTTATVVETITLTDFPSARTELMTVTFTATSIRTTSLTSTSVLTCTPARMPALNPSMKTITVTSYSPAGESIRTVTKTGCVSSVTVTRTALSTLFQTVTISDILHSVSTILNPPTTTTITEQHTKSIARTMSTPDPTVTNISTKEQTTTGVTFEITTLSDATHTVDDSQTASERETATEFAIISSTTTDTRMITDIVSITLFKTVTHTITRTAVVEKFTTTGLYSTSTTPDVNSIARHSIVTDSLTRAPGTDISTVTATRIEVTPSPDLSMVTDFVTLTSTKELKISASTITDIDRTTVIMTRATSAQKFSTFYQVPDSSITVTHDFSTTFLRDTTATSTETVKLESVTLCPSRIVNPRYMPATPLPRNYTWGCPPGTLCHPPQVDCNFEAGPPADTYFCSPSECIPTPKLLPGQFWGPAVTSDQIGNYSVSPGYFNLDPREFGLSYDIFDYPMGTQLKNTVKRVKRSFFSIFSSPMKKRDHAATILTLTKPIPGVCYDECNDCMLEAESVGKTPALCAPNSVFEQFLGYCNSCIHLHSTNENYDINARIPQFQQFLSYCDTESLSDNSPSQSQSSDTSHGPQPNSGDFSSSTPDDIATTSEKPSALSSTSDSKKASETASSGLLTLSAMYPSSTEPDNASPEQTDYQTPKIVSAATGTVSTYILSSIVSSVASEAAITTLNTTTTTKQFLPFLPGRRPSDICETCSGIGQTVHSKPSKAVSRPGSGTDTGYTDQGKPENFLDSNGSGNSSTNTTRNPPSFTSKPSVSFYTGTASRQDIINTRLAIYLVSIIVSFDILTGFFVNYGSFL